MDHVHISSQRFGPGQRVEVATQLHTGDAPIEGSATVLFYDGDPALGAKPFDVERVAHLRARDTTEVRVPYRSDACGRHQVFVVAAKGSSFEQVRTSPPFSVQCP
jgi:hypothetical protein